MNEMEGYWDRIAGPWLAREAEMERLLTPLADALVEAAKLQAGESVLEVGPGSGAGLIRHAEAVGPDGRVVGVDIAPPLAERAQARTGFDVINADAGAGPVEAGAFDAVVSQLGVMFFEDPAAGFRVLGTNLRPGGRLAVAVWGPRPQNPLFAVPGQVAAELFGPPPPADPDAPGPFGLQNASRATALLGEAGFDDVVAMTAGLTLPTGLDAAGFAEVQCDLGPAASRLREEGGDGHRDAMRDRLAEAFALYETDGEVRLPAVAHIFTARWPGRAA